MDRRLDPVDAACVHVLPGHARACRPTARLRYWMDFLAPLGLGGVWLAYFLWQLQRQPLLPLHDYNREAALHLRHLDEEEAAREEGWPMANEEHRTRRRAATSAKDIRLGWLLAVPAAAAVCGLACRWLHRLAVLLVAGGRRADDESVDRSAVAGCRPTCRPSRGWNRLNRLAGVEAANVDKRLAAQEKKLNSYGPDRRKRDLSTFPSSRRSKPWPASCRSANSRRRRQPTTG